MIPVFPLAGRAAVAARPDAAHIFEPRYMEMIDDALASRHRLIGMIQPDSAIPP